MSTDNIKVTDDRKYKKMDNNTGMDQDMKTKFREQIGKYINAIVAFALIFFLIFIISGIWHSIYAASLSGEFFETLAGSEPRNIAITIAVLSFGSIIVIFVLLTLLYMLGQTFCLHLSIFIICVCAILANIILTAWNLANTTQAEQDKFEAIMWDLIYNHTDKKFVQDWIEKNKCTDKKSCQDAVNLYTTFRAKGEFIACTISLIVTFLSIAGIILTIYLMGKMPRMPSESQVQFNINQNEKP